MLKSYPEWCGHVAQSSLDVSQVAIRQSIYSVVRTVLSQTPVVRIHSFTSCACLRRRSVVVDAIVSGWQRHRSTVAVCWRCQCSHRHGHTIYIIDPSRHNSTPYAQYVWVAYWKYKRWAPKPGKLPHFSRLRWTFTSAEYIMQWMPGVCLSVCLSVCPLATLCKNYCSDPDPSGSSWKFYHLRTRKKRLNLGIHQLLYPDPGMFRKIFKHCECILPQFG